MTIPAVSPLLRIALFVFAGLIVGGSVLVWAAGEDDGAVAFGLALIFGAGGLAVVIDKRSGSAAWGSIQVGVAMVLAALVASEAPVAAGNAAVAVGGAISLMAVAFAISKRLKLRQPIGNLPD